MRRRAISSFIAACALSACAHQTTPAVSGVEGMRWIEVEGDDPKLAFGLPNSDVLVLMMTCEARSGQVAIAVFGEAGGKTPTLQLKSGAASTRLAVNRAPSELHDAVVETAAPAATPVLASFARTGELAIGVGTSPTALPAAEPRMSGAFVERCRAPR
jgi:hypothetical protein